MPSASTVAVTHQTHAHPADIYRLFLLFRSALLLLPLMMLCGAATASHCPAHKTNLWGSVRLCVHMWLQWLDECLRLHQEAAHQQDSQQEQQQQASEEAEQQQQQQQVGSALPPAQQAACVVFAPVVGGASEAERERSAKAAVERDVAGARLAYLNPNFGLSWPQL